MWIGVDQSEIGEPGLSSALNDYGNMHDRRYRVNKIFLPGKASGHKYRSWVGTHDIALARLNRAVCRATRVSHIRPISIPKLNSKEAELVNDGDVPGRYNLW